jgi:hypothetical protein
VTESLRRAVVLLAGALGLAGAIPAAAQTYAVMSLVGDRLTIVQPRVTVGSNVDRNPRHEVPTPDDSLDAIAVQAADAAIKRLKPGATTTLFTTRDTKLFALQEALLDADAISPELAQSLKELLAQSNASHLVLITKQRGEAKMRFHSETAGVGRLAGLGYYVDRHTVLKNDENGHRSTGFYAPYAYLRYSVIDAATLRTLRQSSLRDSQVVVSDPTSIHNAWQTTTPEQRVQSLHELLRRAVDAATAQLIGA